MTQRNYAAVCNKTLLAALAGLLLIAAPLRAEPVPGKQDRLVVQLVCNFLKTAHLVKPEIDNEISKRLFQRFLKDLDPTKSYFLKGDIEEFRSYETKLDRMLEKGDISFAYKVYARLLTRIGESQKLVEELVAANHDFTVKEYLSTDYDKVDYASTPEDLRERWRKRIKFELLQEQLAKKPVPEAEAKQKILNRYQGALKRWKQLDNYDLLEIYLSDLTTSVDPHSSYMSPNTLADFDIAMSLQLEGIGALLRPDNGQTIVAEVIPGGAAAQDGRLKVKDRIVGVAQGDDKWVDVIDMKLKEAVKLIRGKRGTPVQLKVVPADKIEPVIYNLTRQKIELKAQEARYEIIEQGKKADDTPFKIGVIDLPSFYTDMAAARAGKAEHKSATEDVRKILRKLKAKGVDGVVLDLRHNGGGALTEALALTGLFINEGAVVQVKGSRGRVQSYDDPEKGVVYGGPLMVLTSRLSASASEILAGALQDYGRAIIVGDPATHGKGTVQVVIDLGSQLQAEEPPKLGALKLTTQQFYRVNGDSTQNRGVLADIVVPSITDQLGMAESELEYALAFDHVKPARHERMDLVPGDLKNILKTRSSQRVKDSKEFAKLTKELEVMKDQRAKKAIPLDAKELRELFAKEDSEKVEKRANGILLDDEPSDTEAAAYKFRRNFVNNEILHIMEDFVRGKKELPPS
jgi:carboxyl-terminal processing protease